LLALVLVLECQDKEMFLKNRINESAKQLFADRRAGNAGDFIKIEVE
jgi:flagellar basal body L-ring protein FlgH